MQSEQVALFRLTFDGLFSLFSEEIRRSFSIKSEDASTVEMSIKTAKAA